MKKVISTLLAILVIVSGFSASFSANAACSHKYKTYITAATIDKNGSTYKKCTKCGNKTSKKVIAKIKTVTLSAESFTYNGKEKKPTVSVKDSKGNALKKDTDFSVKYSKGLIKVGTYSVKVTFKGKYSGSKMLKFKIVPKGTTLSSLSSSKNSITIKWNKQSAQTTGYQIQYSTNSNFSSAKTITINNTSTTSKTVKSLSYSKKYYVRLRTYTISGDVKYYSSWSEKKNVTTGANCKITIDDSDIYLETGDKETLSYTVSPEGTTLTWKSSNTSVAKVSSSGVVTAVSAGTATITASFVYDGVTYKDSCKVTVEESEPDYNEADINFERVTDYLYRYGKISFTKYDNDGNSYGGTIELNDDGDVEFFIYYRYCSIMVTMSEGSSFADFFGVAYTDYSLSNPVVMGSASLNISTYNIDDTINFTDVRYKTGYASAVESGLKMIDAVAGIAFLSWEIELVKNVGVTFADIGFTNLK